MLHTHEIALGGQKRRHQKKKPKTHSILSKHQLSWTHWILYCFIQEISPGARDLWSAIFLPTSKSTHIHTHAHQHSEARDWTIRTALLKKNCTYAWHMPCAWWIFYESCPQKLMPNVEIKAIISLVYSSFLIWKGIQCPEQESTSQRRNFSWRTVRASPISKIEKPLYHAIATPPQKKKNCSRMCRINCSGLHKQFTTFQLSILVCHFAIASPASCTSPRTDVFDDHISHFSANREECPPSVAISIIVEWLVMPSAQYEQVFLGVDSDEANR